MAIMYQTSRKKAVLEKLRKKKKLKGYRLIKTKDFSGKVVYVLTA